MRRVHRLCVDYESLDYDENACRGAHKPYLPADCPFCMLRDDTEEDHIDWSCEDLSMWTVARVMALSSAPPVPAETQTDTETDKTDPAFSGLADSIPDCLVLDDHPGLSDRDTFEVVSAVHTGEPGSLVINSLCSTVEAELGENPRTSSPSLLSVPTVNIEPGPLPFQSTSLHGGVLRTGTARITNGVRGVFQDLVDTAASITFLRDLALLWTLTSQDTE